MKMDVFTVSFLGHRIIANPIAVERVLEALTRNLLIRKPHVVFPVGRDGKFDRLVSSACAGAGERFGKITAPLYA